MTKIKVFLLILLVLIAVGVIAIIVERKAHPLSKLVENVIYDNKNHYLTCDQLPNLEEVGRVVREHKDVVERIITEVVKNIRDSDVTLVWGISDTGKQGDVQDEENFIRFSWGEPYNLYPLNLYPDSGCLGTGKGDIEISYGAHRSRVIIEKIIGEDTFFGIPYRLRNI